MRRRQVRASPSAPRGCLATRIAESSIRDTQMEKPAKAGRYVLQQELGRGAMGVVYRAQDPVIGRQVAVKTVRLDAQAAGMSREELLHRFQTEARAAGLLTHPNIVVVYDAGEEDGLFYITMELVEGKSLQELLNQHTAFPLPRILRIMQQACSALDFAHQNKVVHRDIKPANLMLTADDTVKITDFGTAKILRYGTVQTAQVIGTPSYMSPEQVKGRPADGRSDIFSLGVVLYEMVTGEKPFPGETVTTVIYKIINEEPIPARELDSAVPPGLSAIIARALAKAPAARFQTCRELWEALQNHRDYSASGAAAVAASRAVPSRASTGALPSAIAAATSASSKTISTGQRLPLTVAAATPKSSGAPWLAALLLAVIGVAGYRVWPAMHEVWNRAETAKGQAGETAASQMPQPQTISTQTGTQAATDSAVDGTVSKTPPNSADAPSVEVPASSVESIPAKLPVRTDTEQAVPAFVKTPLETKEMPHISGAQAQQQSLGSEPKPAVPVAERPSGPRAFGSTVAGSAGASASNGALPSNRASSSNSSPSEVATPVPTPAAVRLQRRIEAVLGAAGVGKKVHVTAAGNNVTLSGVLNPAAHRTLVNWLQRNPGRVQIIDDIGFEEQPSSGGAAAGDPASNVPTTP